MPPFLFAVPYIHFKAGFTRSQTASNKKDGKFNKTVIKTRPKLTKTKTKNSLVGVVNHIDHNLL